MAMKSVVKKPTSTKVNKKVANMFDSSKAVTLLVLLLALASLSYFWWSGQKDKVAAYVNGDAISVSDYQRNFEGMKKYKEGQGEKFSSEDKLKELRNETLDRLIKDIVLMQQSEANGVEVSYSEIDEKYKKIVDANTSGDENKFKDQINNLYGFSPEEYKFYFVKVSVYKEKLEEKITKEDSYKKSAKDKIEKAYNELSSSNDFAKIVTSYTEDELGRTNGGDMGWIKKAQTVKEFEDVIFSLERGSVSKVFETPQGFHIVKVVDKKGDEVRVSQILTVVDPFSTWLDNKVKEATVKKLINI
jgi:peptidyl-prolyl cis-trans isomerase SurA